MKSFPCPPRPAASISLQPESELESVIGGSATGIAFTGRKRGALMGSTRHQARAATGRLAASRLAAVITSASDSRSSDSRDGGRDGDARAYAGGAGRVQPKCRTVPPATICTSPKHPKLAARTSSGHRGRVGEAGQ